MRFTCPGCGRAFHLEATEPTPCPACGAALEADSEEHGARTLDSAESARGRTATAGPRRAVPPAPVSSPGEKRRAPAAGKEFPTVSATGRIRGSGKTLDARPPAPWSRKRLMIAAGAVSGASLLAATVLIALVPARLGTPRRRKARDQDEGAQGQAPSDVRPALTGVAEGQAPSDVRPALTGVEVLAVGATEEIAGLRAQVEALAAENAALRDENRLLAGMSEQTRDENRRLASQIEERRREIRALDARMRRRTEATRLCLLAVEFLAGREYERSLSAARSAARTDPALAGARRTAGRALLGLGRVEEALGAFEAADAAARDDGRAGDPQAMVLAGESCLSDLNAPDRAREYHESAARLAAGTPLGLAAKARTLFLGGDIDGAAAKAGEARDADAHVALAPLVLGEAAFERALRAKGPSRAAALREAKGLLADAVRLAPWSPRAHMMRGRVLLEECRCTGSRDGFGIGTLGRQCEAERHLSTASGLSPRMPAAHVALADLRLSRGALRDPGRARESALEAVKITRRTDSLALATLAAAYAGTGFPDLAAKAAEEALQIDPKNKPVRSALARYRADAEALGP